MTDSEKIAYKNNLKKRALDLISKRITTAQEAMEQAQEAANSEEKSSAGDKYETGRAIGHLQKNMYARQLVESVKELAALENIAIDTICREGQAGAFLQGEDSSFFIFAGLGKQIIDGKVVIFLSPMAPLAKSLQNKKVGDTVPFNKTMIRVLNIF